MAEKATSTVRVAVVQAGSVAFDAQATVTKLETLAHQAAANGAQLIVFPEAFISCFPRGSTFESFMGTRFQAVLGARHKEGAELYQRFWESSVEVPGPIVDRLSAVAKQNKVHLVVGCVEREAGAMYCCVLFFGNDGAYLGKHRKVMPTSLERLLWAQGDGSTLPVFDTPVGKVGAVICWENYMPLLRYTMYSKGIQIYCAPTADDSEEWTSTMRHIALEGRCFVLGCNQFSRRSDYPENLVDPALDETLRKTDGQNYIMCRGGSCIVSPSGQFLAGPHFDEEATLYADLDLGAIVRSRIDFDAVGHYTRPDIFTLYVNEKSNRNVVCYSRQPDSNAQPHPGDFRGHHDHHHKHHKDGERHKHHEELKVMPEP